VFSVIPIISFIGRHNSGKTTVLTGVIQHLTSAGYKVAVIKHALHGLNIAAHKDSEMFLQAGADFVLANSPSLCIQYRRQAKEPNFELLLRDLPEDVDLIIVEGYKKEALPKIEVLRSEIDPEPMLLPQTLALVSDFTLPADLPVFDRNAIKDIADFILQVLNITAANWPNN
jgi:molybdopterin-guanine dinucleotide biosynthesis protein B